ncbi:MAG: hypothetical protein Q8N09_01350 [Thermodesulfovibrionia bacterium]|nr:hypothetical protein [Thermodesulfovibrionia bacterium]
MEETETKDTKYIITNLPWKYFDELIKRIAHGELSKTVNYSDEIAFLESMDFIKTEEKEKVVQGYDFITSNNIENKIKEISVSLTSFGKEYYNQKYIKNNGVEAKRILGEALKLHPAVILISQVLSGSKNIKRINIYNLLKHHNFHLDFQDVVLNNFLEILKLGGIVSYNKNTRDVKVLWQQDITQIPAHQFISPETPFSNIKRLQEIIKSLKGTAYWIDKHFDKKAFEILADSLDASKLNSFVIISGDQNKTQSAVNEFLRLRAELHNKGITIEWKTIIDQDILSSFHDRWLCDSITAWNIPPVNTILKGQESEMLKTSNKPNISKLLKHSSLVN